jgi:cell shape-determining protein MreC
MFNFQKSFVYPFQIFSFSFSFSFSFLFLFLLVFFFLLFCFLLFSFSSFFSSFFFSFYITQFRRQEVLEYYAMGNETPQSAFAGISQSSLTTFTENLQKNRGNKSNEDIEQLRLNAYEAAPLRISPLSKGL